jgi:hypothetical protein
MSAIGELVLANRDRAKKFTRGEALAVNHRGLGEKVQPVEPTTTTA